MLQRKTSVAAGLKAASRVGACAALAVPLSVALAIGLGACGQKGPLTLTKPLPQASSPAAVTPAPPAPNASAPQTRP